MEITTRPIKGWIRVRMEQHNKTKGGLLLPDNTQIRKRSFVVEIAEDVECCKVGDEIVFSKCEAQAASPTEVLVFVHKDNIICIVND